MKLRLPLLLTCALLSSSLFAEEILVSAAMSLKDAFTEMGKDFEKSHKDTKINFNFGGSGQLATQIKNGAPTDLFASASPVDMNTLKKEKLVPTENTIFTKNEMVLVVPEKSTLKKLSSPELKKIALGNPKTVPAGRYAMEVLTFEKLDKELKDKMIFGENVRQVLSYVAQGEVDAGFVFSSDALTEKKVKVLTTISDKEHSPIVYPIAVINKSPHQKLAKEFMDYVLSESGKNTLKKYGFK